MMPRKIVFINKYAGFVGGVEKYISYCSSILRANGCHTIMVFQELARDYEKFFEAFDEQYYYKEYDYNSVNIITIHKVMDNNILEMLIKNYFEKLVLFVHDHDFYCPRSSKYTLPFRNNCFKKYEKVRCFFCSLKLNDTISFNQRLNLYKKIPKFVVLSQFMKDNLIINGFDENKINIIHPPIEIGSEEDILAKKEYDIIFSGQLIRGKGVDSIIKAVALMPQKYKLVIVGDGNDKSRLEKLSKSLHLDNNVTFVGWQQEPKLFYKKSKVFVMPSLWQEPFGQVAIEAMSYKLPVITFKIGGYKEWLKEGENGYAIEFGNIKMLSNAITNLLENPQLCEKIGENARNFVTSNFSAKIYYKSSQTILK